jgi:hypothetical protein
LSSVGQQALEVTLVRFAAHAQVTTAPTTPAETWHVLPLGLLYDPYLAGEKESRLSWGILEERSRGRVWDTTVGIRLGLVRHGTSAVSGADGWQVDLEGSAQLRLDPEDGNALESVDYRAGVWLTRRRGRTSIKAGYYHLSAHLGDEFLLQHPEITRVDYVRDAIAAGLIQDVTPRLQLYVEGGYAFTHHGGAEPLELQAGVQYGGAAFTTRRGAPMAAVNLHLRQELDFGGSVNAVLAWGWHSRETGHRVRAGVQAYAGKSPQYSAYRRPERLLGVGLWFDY